METTVINLDAGEEHATYSMDARSAVLAAYARNRGDLDNWNYESKYGHMIKKGKHGVSCGKFWAQDDTFGEININPA